MDCRIFGSFKTTVVIYKFYKHSAGKLYPISQRSIYSKVEPIDKDVSNVEITVPWGKVAGKFFNKLNINRRVIDYFILKESYGVAIIISNLFWHYTDGKIMLLRLIN